MKRQMAGDLTVDSKFRQAAIVVITHEIDETTLVGFLPLYVKDYWNAT